MNSSLATQQSGAALLALLLIIVTGSTYLLISNLNENAKKVMRLKDTRNSLEIAKSALIGYAVRFPEIDAESGTDPIDGPGYLPCPDKNNTGYAGTACSLSGGTTVGRLPYETLEIEELRDAHGERFWYSLSESHKYGSGKTVPLNSNVTANLSIGKFDDVVAVIIAPGESLSDQARPSNEPTDYIEAENSDHDEDYSLRQENSNDIVVYITRQELMSAVEERVIGQLELNVESFYTDNGDNDPYNNEQYPWLSEFEDPDDSSFTGEEGVCAGHLSQKLIDTMPEWFSVNEWHHLIVMIYSDEYRPDISIDCSEPRTDLTVFYSNKSNKINSSPGAVLILSGMALDYQDRKSHPDNLIHYFECENHILDKTYRSKQCLDEFNDKLRDITP